MVVIINRHGVSEEVSFDKISNRLEHLKNMEPLLNNVDTIVVAQQVITQLYNKITTKELDILAAQIATALSTTNLEYKELASRIIISNSHKNTLESFYEKIKLLNSLNVSKILQQLTNIIKFLDNNVSLLENLTDYLETYKYYIDYFNNISDNIFVKNLNMDFINNILDSNKDLLSYFNNTNKILLKTQIIHLLNNLNDLLNETIISDDLFEIVQNNKELIESKIDYNFDYNFKYFGYMTLEKSYLLKDRDGNIIERIQDLLMRVSLGIHGSNLEKAFETYYAQANHYFIMASPCLYNAGTKHPQLLSCFLMGTNDSRDSLFKFIDDATKISQWSGGLGGSISNVRAKDSLIKSTRGKTSGCIPFLKTLNESLRFINQGGKRLGSCAIYMEPHHPDIIDFIQAKLNNGDEKFRARDLFYAIWINNLFMERVKKDQIWSLFSPDDVPELTNVYGDEYRQIYEDAEKRGLARNVVPAREIWKEICKTQIETGGPYLTNGDEVNKKSNQQHYGVIKNSNLCNEITEYSDDKEYACCTLGSIGLPKFVENGTFNFVKLAEIAKILINNLNNIIDINKYPVPETHLSNMRHRPLGLGVQGLADVFALLKISFDSNEAELLNKQIFATIYYSAMEQSIELSKQYGHYPTFQGSPLSQGKFQHDLWDNVDLITEVPNLQLNWNKLREDVMKYGARNSLLTSVQPTASTAQILDNNESIEPYTDLIYTRSTLSGNFIVINKHLIKDFTELGIWNDTVKNKIIETSSIKTIDSLPFIKEKLNDNNFKRELNKLKLIYKTAWELSMKTLINLSADRGPYVCQTQSFNLFVEKPSYGLLSTIHFYSFEKGLKTLMYYLRTVPKSTTQQFTIKPSTINNNSSQESDNSTDNSEVCEMCAG